MATLSSAYGSDQVARTELPEEEKASKEITGHWLAHPDLLHLN